MKASVDDRRDSVLFGLKCLGEVAARRQNGRILVQCAAWRREIEQTPAGSLSEQGVLADAGQSALIRAKDLLAAIKFEMREVLIPFLEVKRPTHEFGITMFPDYFHWLSPERTYTPVELVKILEEDTDKLMIAIEHLQKGPARPPARRRFLHA